MLTQPPLSPKQIAARLNRSKRKGLSAEGRQRLRETAQRNRPWEQSTGPRTAEGKAIAAANAKVLQTYEVSARGLRSARAEIHAMIQRMAATRQAVAKLMGLD
jgi:response regulator RpfG family c-di-GMP phosphodiesterase